MKCDSCGGPVKAAIENYHYRECGLPNVTLSGVEVRRCAECGEFELALPRIEELHRTIARIVIQKPSRLDAAEVKFLRKYLGWSGVDFARRIGVDPATVSKWENGREPIGPQSDRLLRTLVVTQEPARSYPIESVLEFQDEIRPAKKIRLTKSGSSWLAAACA